MISSPRICISSTSGGGGKTLLSLGLGQAFTQIGIAVKPFKKGPDYIDAAWLASACSAPCTSLDPFFLDDAALLQLFVQGMGGYELALIEGNRGLYDGLNASGSCSTARVARCLQAPILLCLDCAKTTRTAAALLNGLTTFEPGLDFVGVVLNRIGSARHEQALRKAIETNTDLHVLGALPRQEVNLLPERHMGLACAGKHLHLRLERILDQLAVLVRGHCNLDAILAAARSAPPLPPAVLPPPVILEDNAPVIGIVRDTALWFYYEENLQALRQSGAFLREISLLADTAENRAAWENLDGLYLGGGFPEDYAKDIAASPFLAKIREYAANGMPIYAECGGLIVLERSLTVNNSHFGMAGVFPGDAVLSVRPQGLGYVEAVVGAKNPWYDVGEKFCGHEFHYSSIANMDDDQKFALELARGTGMAVKNGRNLDGICRNKVWGSYTHIFAPAVPGWAKKFVSLARTYKRGAMP